ncbi:MAG: poly-beta-hydroxybutyrate polymerase [marine bacterium B5-7]|nr:MAG: poly-beta-hydroxybutyrate polymerase [marine bacterium B5-7]
MTRSPLDHQLSAKQLLELSEKLGTGFRHLSDVETIEVNPTPREVIRKDDKTILYQYLTASENTGDGEDDNTRITPTTPLLIVYALVNRPYMMDLEPSRSMLANLVREGVTTYLLDWGYPDASDEFVTLDDYLFDYLDSAVDTVMNRHSCNSVNLLGVCQGGVFSLCYTAARPKRIKNLITMVTPVDFHTDDNLLSQWMRTLDVEAMVDALGNVPGELLNFTFLSLKPFDLTAIKYLDMIDHADDVERLEMFMRMEKWINDSPDQAGAAFAEFVRAFFINNAFVNDNLEIGGHRISLADITVPLLNIIASRDHLVPPSSSRPLETLCGSSDYHVHEEDAGHIGLFVGSSSSRRVAQTISNWLVEHE